MLDAEEYGIPIAQVQQINRVERITTVPTADPFIEGITNLRGEIIPVLNTRTRFGLEARPADDRTRLIIVNLGGVKTGLVVDSVREVLRLDTNGIVPPPEAITSRIDEQFISGVGQMDGGKRMIVLLDVQRMLSPPEQSAPADAPAAWANP
jgi:purine-binding chemotaxis protein CheW